jgi:competence protein ComEA
MFVAALATLGVAARGYRAAQASRGSAGDAASLGRQIAAVDSAVAARAARPTHTTRTTRGAQAARAVRATPARDSARGGLGRGSGRRSGAPTGAETVPAPELGDSSPGLAIAEARRLAVERSNAEARARVAERHALLFPDPPARAAAGAPEAPAARGASAPVRRIDLDTAPADEIATVPGIGPVLATRIVTERTRRGPFGSLSGLQRVKGIGPSLAGKIDRFVTFSRPLSAPPTVLRFPRGRRPPPHP